MKARRTVILAVFMLAGCAHREQIGRISDSSVIAAGTAGGAVFDRPNPVDGAALVTKPGCIRDEERRALLGPVCSHETENHPESRPPTDDLDPGKPKATGQVSWYCDARLVVRVVWAPCDGDNDGKADGVSPLEISVATHPSKPD